MANKEFNKKFMHPTRRKLVNMIKDGEYINDTHISLSNISDKSKAKRKIGDVWEENGQLWEQKSYGKLKKSKGSNELAKVRQYLEKKSQCKSDECEKTKYGVTDKKLIKKTGYCSVCLSQKEAIIKNDGLWQAYQEYKIYSNMAVYGFEVLSKWREALKDINNVQSFVNEDGSVENWTDNVDIETMRNDINDDIAKGEIELEDVLEKRNLAYDKLKDKNYELVKLI